MFIYFISDVLREGNLIREESTAFQFTMDPPDTGTFKHLNSVNRTDT